MRKPSLAGYLCRNACVWIAVAGLTHSAEAETYILATKNSPAVVGSTITTETVSLLKDGKITYTPEDEKIEGTCASESREVITLECLSPTRFRRTQTKLEEHTRMELLGETVDESKDAGPLTGLAVILEKQEKDGSFTAILEKGEATEEQKEELVEIAKEAAARDDLVIYGEQPRKPGDKWNVDVTKLAGFADAQDLRGTMSVELVEVKEVDGFLCAILKNTFDLSGTMEDEDGGEGKMTLKGEELLHRSLADQVNLDSKTKSQMILNTKADDMPGEMRSPMYITIRTTIAKPER